MWNLLFSANFLSFRNFVESKFMLVLLFFSRIWHFTPILCCFSLLFFSVTSHTPVSCTHLEGTKCIYCTISMQECGEGEALNFHFDVDVRPEGPNRGVCRIHCRIRDSSELNFSTKYSHVNWILAQFVEAMKLNSLQFLRFLSGNVLEIYDFGVKVGSWGLKKCWNGSLASEWPGGCEKGVFRTAHTRTHFLVIFWKSVTILDNKSF